MKEEANRFVTAFRNIPFRWSVYLSLDEACRVLPPVAYQIGKPRSIGYIERLQLVSLSYPSHFSRNWLKYIGGALGIFWSWKKIQSRHTQLGLFFESVGGAARSFWQQHIVSPLKMIYKEVFHSSYRTFMDPIAVQAEQDALNRMVVDFTRETYARLPEAERRQAELLAANGDLSPVMKIYEQQIRSPVVNMLAGDVIRALLIQVQKLKVDVEQEMVAVDSLVRSNELNLQVAAAVPGLLAVIVVISAGYRALQRWWRSVRSTEVDRFGSGGSIWTVAGGERFSARERARWLIRDVERFFMHALSLRRDEMVFDSNHEEFKLRHEKPRNPSHGRALASACTARSLVGLDVTGNARISKNEQFRTSSVRDDGLEQSREFLTETRVAQYENEGRILLTLDELEDMLANHLKELGSSSSAQHAARLREDLADLRSAELDLEQKLLTILRMRWTYPFLHNF
ncbi:Nuclear control of ATPase protein 2 [Cyanidiococcus yangmingshanensis]|uniref:Nuclear control of ATPase protein 2 n=1 Tax=Cyanidiococcus yangmingshanensis TaxID=2690220 RepID=A0A7J7IL74_9RHOD|nr:Nuclear control of ATPase protein 2 [Cyanidiococcus yangmingshanensis]